MTFMDEKVLVLCALIPAGIAFVILIYLILFEYLNP